MKKSFFAAFLVFPLLFSCHNTDDNNGSGSKSGFDPASDTISVQKMNYDIRDAYTIPLMFETAPDGWGDEREHIGEWDDRDFVTLTYFESTPFEQELTPEETPLKNWYEYGKESGELHAFCRFTDEEIDRKLAQAEEEGALQELSLLSRGERKQKADEYLAYCLPGADLVSEKEEESRGDDMSRDGSTENFGFRYTEYFVYAPPAVFGEWKLSYARENWTVVIGVNIFGEITSYECNYDPKMIDEKIADVTKNEIRERMEQEESYQRYLNYRETGTTEDGWNVDGLTCDVSDEITIALVDGRRQAVFTAYWKADYVGFDLETMKLKSDGETFYYPLSEYGVGEYMQKKLDEYDAVYSSER